MAYMRITKIEIQVLNIDLKQPFITSLRRVDQIEDIVVKIHTDTDLVGYGEACAVTAITGTTNEDIIKDLENILIPCLLNKRIDENTVFIALHQCKAHPESKACIDIALFDLLAKHSSLSLHRYLGSKTSSLQTDLTISLNTPSLMQAETIKALDLGFKVLKIKLDADFSQNIKRLKAVNEVLAPAIRLRLDPNQALRLDTCVQMLEGIKTDNIECMEQPFAAKDISSMKRLKQMNIVPVLADESLFTLKDAQILLEEKAIDMLNIKLMKCGGIYQARKISLLAKEFNKGCMIGSMLEGPISLLAAAHFALSQDNIIMADLDSPLYLKEHPLLDAFNLNKDTINLSDKLGLGIDTMMQNQHIFPGR